MVSNRDDRHRDLAWLEAMALIRRFEELAGELWHAGEIRGSVHQYIGQEAIAVGVCSALGPRDYVASYHRGHGHCLAKGADVDAMMRELLGREGGTCGGKGGSHAHRGTFPSAFSAPMASLATG